MDWGGCGFWDSKCYWSTLSLERCWTAPCFQFFLRFINFQSRYWYQEECVYDFTHKITHNNVMINGQTLLQNAWLFLPFFLSRSALLLSAIWSCPLLLDSLCNAEINITLHLQFIIKPGCASFTRREQVWISSLLNLDTNRQPGIAQAKLHNIIFYLS